MKKIFLIMFLAVFAIPVFSQKFNSRPQKSIGQKLNDEYCSDLFRMEDGTILDVASDNSAKAYFNILDWIQGRVAGLQIYTTRWGVPIPVIRGQRAAIYLDEVPVNPDGLNSIPVTDIAMVKVIKGPNAAVFGSTGVIAVYTLKGDDEEEE